MKRGVITLVDALVLLAITVIIILVSTGFLGRFEKKAEAAEEKGECNWAIMSAGLRKAGTLSIAEGIPEGCKTRIVTVTMESIRKHQIYAKNRLETMRKDKAYESVAAYFLHPPTGVSEEQLVNEFALNRIVAGELEECWTRVWRGKMPLFDEWWRLYDCIDSKSGRSVPCSKLQDFAISAIPLYGAWETITGGIKFNRVPTNCYKCAHIKFDKEIRNYFNRPITSLREWLAINPMPNSRTSYLEYLMEGQAGLGTLFKMGGYTYEVTPEGLAIVYERVNAQQLVQLTGITFVGTPEDQNLLEILQNRQDTLVAPSGKCTFILR
jgi:hypothetical protein